VGCTFLQDLYLLLAENLPRCRPYLLLLRSTPKPLVAAFWLHSETSKLPDLLGVVLVKRIGVLEKARLALVIHILISLDSHTERRVVDYIDSQHLRVVHMQELEVEHRMEVRKFLVSALYFVVDFGLLVEKEAPMIAVPLLLEVYRQEV